MKKVILLLFIVCLYSCKKEPGTVSGVVTYFFNQYQGDKPDIGAKIYVVEDRADLKESIKLIKKCETPSSLSYEQSNIYYLALYDKKTIEKSVDGNGNYTVQVPPGDHIVIIESNGRKFRKEVQPTTVKSGEISNVDCKFDVN